MTKLLDKALDAVRRLSSDEQDKVAREIIRLVEDEGEPQTVDPAHLSAILEGLAQADRRDFAANERIEAAFRRFDA